MIDFHSHVLPGIDDGSRHVADSVEMLRRMRLQNVDTVLLTPHFYVNEQSVESFLERRNASFERLRSALDEEIPRLLLGAEVQYYRGISQNENLIRLCIEGTHILLLEMPFSKWSESEIREVCELAYSGEVTVVLAHIERYLPLQSRRVWDRLYRSGALMQCNAEFFLAPFVRLKALRLFRQGRVHLLGTDTHNLTTRAPHMDLAAAYIQKHMGKPFFEAWDRRCYELLND